MNRRFTPYTAVALFLASCAHNPASTSPLLGTLAATSPNAAGSSFQFRADGTATWKLGQAFEIQYQTDDPRAPTRVDLSGFQSGPLKGRTLYCLIDLSDDTLQMDCEPSGYPSSFNPEQTQVFSRQPGSA
jgi:hypothetical protein